jgi:hypothetical protein
VCSSDLHHPGWAGGPPPSFRERHRVRLAVGAVPEWALEFVNPRSTRRRLQAVWEVEP